MICTRRDAGAEWLTIDASGGVEDGLRSATPEQSVLLDCATMWLTNLMMDEADIGAAQADLLTSLADCPAPWLSCRMRLVRALCPRTPSPAGSARHRDV